MSTCNPIYQPIQSPYGQLDNPYNKLCAPGTIKKVFQDGMFALFEDDIEIIFN